MASAPTEAQEVAALDRVLTRLVLTGDVALQPVLAKLLPGALEQLATPHGGVRAKTLELLSHVNKRLRAAPTLCARAALCYVSCLVPLTHFLPAWGRQLAPAARAPRPRRGRAAHARAQLRAGLC